MRRAPILALCVWLLFTHSSDAAPPARNDVLIYGGTPAGIAAALAAAHDGQTVALVEPTPRIGGLVTSGLSHTDFHAFEGLTGAFLEFSHRIQEYYRTKYGPDSPQARGTFRGTHAEPKVNLAVLEAMLGEHKSITILREHRLLDVQRVEEAAGPRLTEATFKNSQGQRVTLAADLFIDASYEGDLMARAKVQYHVGREGRDVYGESLAPPETDGELQAYNFRLVMTQELSNLVPIPQPQGYNREDYVDIVPLLKAGTFTRIFGTLGEKVVYKAQEPPLPNNKYDINDVSRAPVRLSLPGENLDWPEGDEAARQAIYDTHIRWNVGLLYFLQHDEAVPQQYRDEVKTWGFCKDEFTETRHLPPQLYVREARRMVGAYVYTQKDTEYAPGDARAVLRADAIAMGEYSHNCHGTSHEGPKIGGKHTGEFYQATPPYQIPYGVLCPKDVTNLLVPVACSASHVGFCALRLEPIWMSLGQAAGHAVKLARAADQNVRKVPVPELQRRLHERGAATIYTSDVLPGHPQFAVVQWWGNAGGLHGLHPSPAKPGQRGKKILGQYTETYPGHTVDLDQVLDEALAQRWTRLALELGIPKDAIPAADGKRTRGEWLQAIHRAAPAR